MRRDRLDTNPAFSGRKLKLGTFQTNLDSGSIMSGLEGRLDLTWPNTVTLSKLADEMEFELLVPVARWRGFGGANDPQGPGFEAYTWAAGIAASTARCGVVSTSHVSLNIQSSPPSNVPRSNLQRPLHAQRRVRLERPGDEDV